MHASDLRKIPGAQRVVGLAARITFQPSNPES